MLSGVFCSTWFFDASHARLVAERPGHDTNLIATVMYVQTQAQITHNDMQQSLVAYIALFPVPSGENPPGETKSLPRDAGA